MKGAARLEDGPQRETAATHETITSTIEFCCPMFEVTGEGAWWLSQLSV